MQATSSVSTGEFAQGLRLFKAIFRTAGLVRVARLAQMTSGQVTDSGLEGARELFEQAQRYKAIPVGLNPEPLLQAAS